MFFPWCIRSNVSVNVYFATHCLSVCNSSDKHWAVACYGELMIVKTGLIDTPGLCTLGSPKNYWYNKTATLPLIRIYPKGRLWGWPNPWWFTHSGTRDMLKRGERITIKIINENNKTESLNNVKRSKTRDITMNNDKSVNWSYLKFARPEL